MPREQRRLAAIVCADVAGFSRLMSVDEGGTLTALKSHLRALFEPKISEYAGRIVKTTGDGLLVEFASVVDAVRCAVDVQRGMADRNAGVAPEKRIDFRIGINVGDIIIDGDDIFGDGVNVAARLQTLADPGEICVSKVVRDQVLDKLGFAFEDLGPQRVKNIARPVEAYRVELGTVASNNRQRWRQLTRSRALHWLGAGMIAAGVLGVVLWSVPQLTKTTPAREPPAFSLAVLPFTVVGTQPADDQVADLVVHGIVAALGRTARYIPVLSLPAAAANQTTDTRTIARESNVRYVLQGNVRIESDVVGVATKLIDADTSTQVWTGQFDAARSKWIGEFGEAPSAVSRQLRDAVWRAEEQRVAHQAPKATSTPADLVLRAAILERQRSPQRWAEASALVDEALRQDPSYVLALRERVRINAFFWENDPGANRVQLAQESDELARRALAVDRTDPGIWRTRSYALWMQWRWDAAMDALDEARRLDPSDLNHIVGRTWMLSMMGHADEALCVADEAAAREPSLDTNPNFRHNQCYAQLLLGLFDKAIAACEKSAAGGDDWWPYFFLAVAYARSGDLDKAAAAKAELLRRRPSFSITQLNAMGLSDNPIYLKQVETNIIPGLRKAGVPER